MMDFVTVPIFSPYTAHCKSMNACKSLSDLLLLTADWLIGNSIFSSKGLSPISPMQCNSFQNVSNPHYISLIFKKNHFPIRNSKFYLPGNTIIDFQVPFCLPIVTAFLDFLLLKSGGIMGNINRKKYLH